MNAMIDTNGIIWSARRPLWGSAGRAVHGHTPGGAQVRWFEAVFLPAATLTPVQEATKAAGGHRREKTLVYGRPTSGAVPTQTGGE